MESHLLKAFYFCFYLGIGSMQFLNLYYANFGLSKGEIGILFAVGPFVMICTQPLWGILTDYWERPKFTLFLTLVGSAATVAFFPFSMDFQHLLILTILYSFFQSAVSPIADSTALSLLQDRNDFGKIRLWGSLGYAVGVVSIGRILDFFGLALMFGLHSGLLICSFIIAIMLPVKKGGKKHFQLKEAVGLLKKPVFIAFLAFHFILQLTVHANNSFYSIYLETLGANVTLIGIALLIKSILEIPFFAMSTRLMSRFSYPMLLTIAAAIYSVRWLVLGFSDNLPILIWSQILLSLSFALQNFVSVAYVDDMTPKRYRATGQTLYWAISFGLGGVVGNILAGMALNDIQIPHMYQMSAFLAALSILLLWACPQNEKLKTNLDLEKDGKGV